MAETEKRYGRTWVIVIIVVVILLPLITLFLLKEGFKIREHSKASTYIFPDTTLQIPDYFFVSHRGDTITKSRMMDKVCVLNFLSYSCGKKSDQQDSLLFQLQEDYYGKTKGFRILSITLTPENDGDKELEYMAERYQAREIWHFLRSGDSSENRLFQFCRSVSKKPEDTDLFCPRFVYLVDGYGNLRGCYDPLDHEQYNALYEDVLFLINHLYAEEKN